MIRMIFLVMMFPASVFACSVGDFKVDKLRGVNEHQYLSVYGALTHACQEPMGVQVKLTVFDSKGDIVDVVDGWPASVNNIAPNTPYNFRLMAKSSGKGGKYTIEPIAVKHWNSRR